MVNVINLGTDCIQILPVYMHSFLRVCSFMKFYHMCGFYNYHHNQDSELFLYHKETVLKNYFIYLFFREGEGERVGEKHQWVKYWLGAWNINQEYPQPRTWPATQGCTLTRNQTCDLLVCRTTSNPLSHTSQDHKVLCYPLTVIIPSPKSNVWQLLICCSLSL